MIASQATALFQDAGQVLIAGFPAGEPPDMLMEAARQQALGGFILFKRNLPDAAETVRLVHRLRACTPADAPPPWVSVDQEGGRVARLGAPVLRLPPMRILGSLDDLALTARAGACLGRQLRALGFNLDYAPVLDVDTHPANPVIGDRAFGSDPLRVLHHGRAFAQGLQREGVAACAKHFPGHGDTDLDSHLTLPRVRSDLGRLTQVELAPFAGIGADVVAFMTAHVIYDALDAARPATLSPAILTGLLRERLGFRGLVISDDLEMRAICDHYGIAEAACLAVEAGCDALLVCSKPDQALEAREALVAKAEKDVHFRERLREAAARGRSARRAFPGKLPDPAWHTDPAFADGEAGALEQVLAAR
jgi:beta-N-acetylhexosaminidase